MDTHEDNLERWAPLQTIKLAPMRVRVRPAVSPAPNLPCPACARSFASDQALKQHLFSMHANGGFYIRVDDNVVPDVAFVERMPQTMEFIPLGADPVGLTAQFSQGEPIRGMVPPGGRLDLLALLRLDKEAHGVLTVTGTRGGLERTYQLHLQRPPVLNFASLDALVTDAQGPLLVKRPANWEELQSEALRPSRGALETRYLSGFAELLLGYNQELHERHWQSAGGCIARAFGYLRIFTSDLARSACALLAFRMNAYRYLLDDGPGSIFWQAANFFQIPSHPASTNETQRPVSGGLWMDDYQEGLLRAVEAADRSDWEAADAEVRELPSAFDCGPGNDLKRLVLTARIAARLGQAERAENAYTELLNDPEFGEEARTSR
jgi:hypothetical protein